MLKNAISREQIKKTKIFRDQNKKNNQKKKEKKPL
jgi:hypothetical protein